jgi:hypothetical protein
VTSPKTATKTAPVKATKTPTVKPAEDQAVTAPEAATTATETKPAADLAGIAGGLTAVSELPQIKRNGGTQNPFAEAVQRSFVEQTALATPPLLTEDIVKAVEGAIIRGANAHNYGVQIRKTFTTNGWVITFKARVKNGNSSSGAAASATK